MQSFKLFLFWSNFRNSARFLWKRIPAAVKQSQPELVAAWKIGQCLWTYDYAGVHDALRSYSWSPAVHQIVTAIGGKLFKCFF